MDNTEALSRLVKIDLNRVIDEMNSKFDFNNPKDRNSRLARFWLDLDRLSSYLEDHVKATFGLDLAKCRAMVDEYTSSLYVLLDKLMEENQQKEK